MGIASKKQKCFFLRAFVTCIPLNPAANPNHQQHEQAEIGGPGGGGGGGGEKKKRKKGWGGIDSLHSF